MFPSKKHINATFPSTSDIAAAANGSGRCSLREDSSLPFPPFDESRLILLRQVLGRATSDESSGKPLVHTADAPSVSGYSLLRGSRQAGSATNHVICGILK